MKRFGMTAMISMLLLFFLFGFTVLLVSGRTTGYLKQMKNQKTRIRAEESLKDAEQGLKEGLEAEIRAEAETAYEQLIFAIDQKQYADVSEAEVEEIFKQDFTNRIKNSYAADAGQACARLEEYLPKPEKGTLSIDSSTVPEFSLVTEETTGTVTGCILKGVTLRYDNGVDYQKTRNFDFLIHMPEVCFFDGNDALFEYSLIGNKGIYATGKTSSIVGNVFAGSHQVSENRKAEAGYGEKGVYGGLNILSTQLGIQADRIVSAGDINLKGSFVLFGSEEEPTSIYAEHLNQMDGYPTESVYHIEGTEFLREAGREDTDSETDSETNSEINNETDDGGFTEISDMMKTASGKLYKLEYYYDSENDEDYRGSYRKVLSGSDVTISEDFTGVLITSGNVIIDTNCNIEGMIFAGDRIYIQGNNNIVSNREILRTIISEEYRESKNDELETAVEVPLAPNGVEETAGTGELPADWYEISHRAMDYIAGLSFHGLNDQSFIYVELL